MIEQLHRPDLLKVLEVLSQAGGEARVVGGSIRDALLCTLCSDFYETDIATTLTPDETEQVMNSAGYSVFGAGKKFGTVSAFANGKLYEITSLREDVETDGRRAVVSYTTDWQKDSMRRDFTVNAMSYDPFERKIYDYSTGLADIKQGILRFVGDPDRRVQEDYLRILRYFRFMSTHPFSEVIDSRAIEACCAHKEQLAFLSPERRTSELVKLLQGQNYLAVVKRMFDLGVLTCVANQPVAHSFQSLLERLEAQPRVAPDAHDSSMNLRKDDAVTTTCNAPKRQHVDHRVKLWAIFGCNAGISALQIFRTFRLSRTDFDCIACLEKVESERDPYYVRYKFGFEYLRYWVAYQGRHPHLLATLEHIPEFPLNVSHLIHAGFARDVSLGRALAYSEKVWCEFKYQLSVQEMVNMCIVAFQY